MTAEELLRVPDVDGRHELIAGELVTLSFGGMARGLAGMIIGGSLGQYVHQQGLGVTLNAHRNRGRPEDGSVIVVTPTETTRLTRVTS